MEFLAKIENFINQFILKLSELLLRIVPSPIKKIFHQIRSLFLSLLILLKNLPANMWPHLKRFAEGLKANLSGIDFKAIFVDSYKRALTQYKTETAGSPGKLKTLLLAPFLVIGQWVQGLNPVQTLLLLTFSGFSILAVIGIGFSGKRIADSYSNMGRNPASTPEDIQYERPIYYKEQLRHLSVTNFRLPVYVAKVNEIRSVDIDFTATVSNRGARMFLEKHEFHLRDHLILQIEPSVASFPLEEEGKEIIRNKLFTEINDFMKINGIEGEVTNIEITYVLAN